MTTGVVISTYNNPEWLEKTLLGYMSQSCKADEIIIADDGSTDDTRKLIERYSTHLPIIHVWHEDNGFRKTEILNKAISAATADYLIFTDQDCIPRRDFIETHRRYAREGYFLSGGYFKLPMDISRDITPDDIASGRAFDLKWLVQVQQAREIEAVYNADEPHNTGSRVMERLQLVGVAQGHP